MTQSNGSSAVRSFQLLTYLLVLRPQGAPDVWPRVTAAMKQAITWPQANDPPFARAARAFALANAVPCALTLDKEVKERLICGDQPVDESKSAARGVPPRVPIPPLRFWALALLQTIVSSVCVCSSSRWRCAIISGCGNTKPQWPAA